MAVLKNNAKRMLSIVASAVFGLAQAADSAYEWDAQHPSTSFGDGKVVLELVDGGPTISSLSASTAVGDTVFFLGDRMDFAAEAEISVTSGGLIFSNAVNAAGDLSVVGKFPPASWSVSEGMSLYTDVPTTVLEDYDLANIRVTGGRLAYNAKGEASPYFVKRGETDGVAWMELQLQQWLGPGNSTKVVKIRLEQDGPDITAKTIYAKYEVNKLNALGHDFDVGSKSNFVVSAYNLPSSTSSPTYRYGCNALSFEFEREQSSARIVGTFACGGGVFVGDGMRFDVADQPVLVLASANVTTNAKFVVTAEAATDLPSADVACDYVSKDGLVFAANRNIREIRIETIRGKLAGNSLSVTPMEAWTGYFKWKDSATLSFEVQVNQNGSSLAKGIRAHLVQVGADVKVVADGAYYYTGTAGTHSYEETTGVTGYAYAPSNSEAGYCLGALSVAFRRHAGSQVTLSGACSCSGGEVVVEGSDENRQAELRVMDKNGLPSNGVVRVERYGTLTLLAKTSMSQGISNGTTEFYIGPGGTLQQGGEGEMPATFHYSKQKLTVDGGIVEFGYGIPSKWDPETSADAVDTYGSTYLNYLMLKNGARCYGRAVRVGNNNALWSVTGSSPSTWDGDISLMALTGSGQAWAEFVVDDVSASDAVDFTVTGDMKMFKPKDPDNYKKLHIYKEGTGTMRVNGVTDFNAYPLVVKGGVWMVGSDATMNATQDIRLESGSFAAADGVHATVGRLSTDASGGGVIVGADSIVSFADSHEEDWSGPVGIQLSQGGKVRFGTSNSALTAGQLAKLRCNGHRVQLDHDGYVVPCGMLLIFR